MLAFAWLSLSASIICIVLALTVYFLNRKALLNKLFTVTVLFIAYWSFSEFMMRISASPDAAMFWNKMGFLWPFFAAFLFNFIVVFTESNLLKNRRNYLLLYLPAIVFALLELTTNQISGNMVLQYWGYTYSSPNTWLRILCNLWSGIVAYSALFLCVRYYQHASKPTKRQQTKYMALSFAIPILTFSITEVILPALNINVPELGNTSSAFMSIFVAFAIWKYELFTVNPALAAENILHTMPDSLILADLQGKIIRVNPSMVDFSGYAENELKNKAVDDLFAHKPDCISIASELRQKKEVRGYETVFQTKQGQEKTVLLSCSIVSTKRGQSIGVTYVIQDITHLKELEKKLVKAERFASIGELAGMIGHDLRNPLTSIQGAAYYLKIKYAKDLNDPGREMLDTIQNSIQYSNKIISDLLDYSREIKLETEETNPRSLVINACALIPAPPNIQLLNVTQEEPKFLADTGKMNRVFVNIIKNAFEAMPNGGVLTITSAETADSVEFRFQDTGSGMSLGTLGKLWTPLFTTKAKGMGFGLPICKRMVEAHGGRMYAESTLGKGTAIIVTLLLKAGARQPASQQQDADHTSRT